MTQADALTQALWSSIHCPEDMVQQFIRLAEEISEGMTEKEIERCKEVALAMDYPE